MDDVGYSWNAYGVERGEGKGEGGGKSGLGWLWLGAGALPNAALICRINKFEGLARGCIETDFTVKRQERGNDMSPEHVIS